MDKSEVDKRQRMDQVDGSEMDKGMKDESEVDKRLRMDQVDGSEMDKKN